MSDFEKAYYEAETFWAHEAIQDENNLLRMRETAAMVPADVRSLADIGCGNGVFVNYLTKERPALDIMAVDRSEAALKYVKTNKQLGDIAAIPLPDNAYDCVTCLEVVEHLPVTVYETALRELGRISGKYVIISVPYNEELEENHTQCPYCKTIFNADLHLRRYSEAAMTRLMDANNYKCISVKKICGEARYKGHYKFRKLFYPGQFRLWRSPICPVCGYQSASLEVAAAPVVEAPPAAKPGRSLLSYFTALPKRLWPKEIKYRWIMGLYQKQ
jgi:ubiquinone/menaquinone biosynthesis C-methylase UbiE